MSRTWTRAQERDVVWEKASIACVRVLANLVPSFAQELCLVTQLPMQEAICFMSHVHFEFTHHVNLQGNYYARDIEDPMAAIDPRFAIFNNSHTRNKVQPSSALLIPKAKAEWRKTVIAVHSHAHRGFVPITLFSQSHPQPFNNLVHHTCLVSCNIRLNDSLNSIKLLSLRFQLSLQMLTHCHLF
jgi:hypothetical protein